ncbi:hypothetical protein M405DRAFT_29502 [Rhizopogon salebrosus TDB-379]|nr:hypothetical protein M405DRAFT_29502 [Rhizopogon salebrosus TDB-379]
MLNQLNADTMKLIGSSDPEAYNENFRKKMSVGYLGTPNDIAGLVSYIASEESHFITGKA